MRRILALLIVVLLTTAAAPERRIVRLTNRYRSASGIGFVLTSPPLVRFAEEHSKVMARRDSLFHSHLGFRGANCKGEVIGVGPSLISVWIALLASPEHEAVISDNCYDRVGVGVVRRDGRVWVTEDFAG